MKDPVKSKNPGKNEVYDWDYVSFIEFEKLKAKKCNKGHKACLLSWELENEDRFKQLVDFFIFKEWIYPDAEVWHWRRAARRGSTGAYDPALFMRIMHDNAREPFGKHATGRFFGYDELGRRESLVAEEPVKYDGAKDRKFQELLQRLTEKFQMEGAFLETGAEKGKEVMPSEEPT